MKRLLSILLVFCISKLGYSQNYEEMQHEMVREQIENRGIYHKATLNAIRKVSRHLSQPFMVAYMTQLLQPKQGHRILEVGTGSGYQAAVLAEIVETVNTIEIVKGLGLNAISLLHKLGYHNIEVIIGDGYQGLASKAPFDTFARSVRTFYQV